jgi:hypothetical protein
MSWIEASYNNKTIPDYSALKKWASNVTRLRQGPNKTTTTLLGLAQYLSDLDCEWGHHLLSDPTSIWDEVTAFTASNLLPQTSGTVVQYLVAMPPTKDDCATEPCFEISQTSLDGEHTGVISIWPSRYFVFFNLLLL